MTLHLTPGRSCGECNACCIVLAVVSDEIQKPAKQACVHCSTRGCEIYDTRFSVCREYFCLWRKWEKLDADTRPDKVGILFQFVSEPENRNPLRHLYVAAVPLKEFPDYDSPQVRAVLDVLRSRRVPVWLKFGAALKCVHPERRIQELLQDDTPITDDVLAAEVEAWRKALAGA